MTSPNIGQAVAGSREERLVIAAFTLTACEVFLIYRNFRLPASDLVPIVMPFLGGFASVCVSLLACVAMLAVYLARGVRVGHDRHLMVATVCASIAPIVQLGVGHYLGIAPIVLPCITVTSIGCACFLPAIIQHLVVQGVQCSVRCSVSCCLALLFVAPASMLAPIEGHIALMVVIPIATLACFRLLGPVSEPEPVDAAAEGRPARAAAGEHQKLPRILMLTVLLASMLEGAVAAVNETQMNGFDKFVVFSGAFVVAAIALFVVILRMRGSFNSALYRLCIPLMGGGLALFVLGNHAALVTGAFLMLVGRQLFAGTVLALVVYLVRYHGSDYYLLTLGVVIGTMVGNLIGLVLYQMFGRVEPPAILPAPFIVFALLFTFVATLFLMNASNLKTHWGMTAIDDTQESVGLTFEQSCEELAQRHGLTKREGELLPLMARGKDKQAIAAKLFISEGTVKVHSRNIYQKLNIHSKQELIALVEELEESIKE